MLIIRPEQFADLSRLWMARVEADIVRYLCLRFRNHEDAENAAAFAAIAPQDVERFVHRVMEIGADHGFASPADFQALVDGCADWTAARFLSDPVLRHEGLTPAEKVAVMNELCMQELMPHAPDLPA